MHGNVDFIAREKSSVERAQAQGETAQAGVLDDRQFQRNHAEISHSAGRDGGDFQRHRLGERYVESRRLQRIWPAMRHAEREANGVARPVGGSIECGQNNRIGIDRVKQIVKNARVRAHVEKAVRLPVTIGQLGDDVAGDLRLPAHGLDLVFQRPKLLPLRRFDEAFERPEYAIETPVLKSVANAMRIHDAFAPVVARLEPPGFGAGRVSQFLRVGQPPIAKFRA